MYAIGNSNLNLSWIDSCVNSITFRCSIFSQNFKREDHLKYHEEIRINEIQVPTMVDMLINSDKTVPEIGSVADKTLITMIQTKLMI